ncbi:putative receptor-like protein kinase [Nymphaea thermarum]|nr:putative receptor-like protein kinase [Nymphaea thermarum]
MWLQLFAAIASFQVLYVVSSRGYSSLLDGYQEMFNIKRCPSFSCGEVKEISYPFKLQGSKCRGFPLICQDNTTLLINLTRNYPVPRFQGIYHVKKINVSSMDKASWIQIADPNFASNDSASSVCLLPRYSTGSVMLDSVRLLIKPVTWVRCRKTRGDGQLDPATYLPLPCPDNNASSSSSSSSVPWRSYLLSNTSMTVERLDRSCQVAATTAISYDNNVDLERLNLTAISSQLQMGFRVEVRSLCDLCDDKIDRGCPEFCQVCGIVPRILGILFLAGLLIYKLKNKYSPSDNVEKLLQKCQILMPRRYSYPEIKIITGHFKEKLGQGGFGSVFKGSLFDGRAVAVKLLGKAKGGGQDFINEVSTIGRIHHVNIVRLLGFCSEGSTRALVYEFMPNGSLDKYLFLGNNRRNHPLSWEMLYKIALGIARGIEYLHRGCDMCILHFDIKPHNVLLDEYFCPKISDFGLAKLSPTQNTMTLSGYRGTIGYIAPEQVSRNFGRVSYKSDVYSFGILLLQVVERTKKQDVFAPAGSSQTYFPAWIYDRLSEGDDVGIGEATEIEEEIVKKLALVGLCCIQMMPANRPSMSQAIEMLEGSSDTLQLPPRLAFIQKKKRGWNTPLELQFPPAAFPCCRFIHAAKKVVAEGDAPGLGGRSPHDGGAGRMRVEETAAAEGRVVGRRECAKPTRPSSETETSLVSSWEVVVRLSSLLSHTPLTVLEGPQGIGRHRAWDSVLFLFGSETPGLSPRVPRETMLLQRRSGISQEASLQSLIDFGSWSDDLKLCDGQAFGILGTASSMARTRGGSVSARGRGRGPRSTRSRNVETRSTEAGTPIENMQQQQAFIMNTLQIITGWMHGQTQNTHSGGTSTDTNRTTNGEARGATHQQFMNLHPPKFHGKGTADDAEQWLMETEEIFATLEVPDNKKVLHLEKYCPHVYTTDASRANKFVRGLRDGLRREVMGSRPRDLDDAIDMAKRFDEDSNRTRGTDRNSELLRPKSKPDIFKRRRSDRVNQGDRFKRQRPSTSSQNDECPKCHRQHPGKPCYRDTGACLYCGAQGHFIRECPKKKEAEQKRGAASQPTERKFPPAAFPCCRFIHAAKKVVAEGDAPGLGGRSPHDGGAGRMRVEETAAAEGRVVGRLLGFVPGGSGAFELTVVAHSSDCTGGPTGYWAAQGPGFCSVSVWERDSWSLTPGHAAAAAIWDISGGFTSGTLDPLDRLVKRFSVLPVVLDRLWLLE